MTNDQKVDRVAFARSNLKRSWDDVVFVDKASFYAYQPGNIAYQKECQRLTYPIPKYPPKLHVWAGINVNGTTDLAIFEENLTGKLYTDILRDYLLPSMRRLYGRNPRALIQINDPKHKSKTVF